MSDKVLIVSVDEFPKQVANARKRLSLCRLPEGHPEFEPSTSPTGEQHRWQNQPLYRQLHSTTNSENNHKRIQDIHESSNHSNEMAGALTLHGINDKNRRNSARKGAPTTDTNHGRNATSKKETQK